ncbi:hypothetical protein H8R03_33205 [Streptomyces sp. JH010]|uniref:hypothetical protein n=1 Tax=Streptomyces TaxID=1883 RepID=UPI0023F8D720|nr:hypothetical protein [Streptomyces sp. JH010]MDF6066759.1 hypothetical protein [Streptomyces sp. JH010]
MATISAIPANLHKYSATCTKAAEELQSWVHAVLKPAINLYQSKRGPCDPYTDLDWSILREVAAAFGTDRDVKMVARAFLVADSGDFIALGKMLLGYLLDGVSPSVTAPLQVDEEDLNAALLSLQEDQEEIGEPTYGDALEKSVQKWGLLFAQKYGNKYRGAGWDWTLSIELWDAYNLPFPSVDPDGSRFSAEQNAVLSWVEAHRDIILKEAKSRKISPQAIVAAIAWEALENPSPTVGYKWTGPGKVHYRESLVVEQVEQNKPLYGNPLSRQSELSRALLLSTNEGSIKYIAAIMSAYADVTDTSRNKAGNKFPSIRYDVEMLAHVYQGGGPQRNLAVWKSHLENKKSSEIQAVNDMALWVSQNKWFLNLAMPEKP